MAITKEQIFQAADQLDAEGQNPTLANVRKALDGGSFTTISEAMKEWRANKQENNTPVREPAPEAVTEKFHSLGLEVWSIALELANGRLAGEREALETARIEMETAQQEAVELADQLSRELDEAKQRIEELKKTVSGLSADLKNSQDNLSLEKERARTAEAKGEEIEKRAAELRKELDKAHSNIDKLQKEKDRSQEAEKKAAEEAAQLRGRLEGLEAVRKNNTKK